MIDHQRQIVTIDTANSEKIERKRERTKKKKRIHKYTRARIHREVWNVWHNAAIPDNNQYKLLVLLVTWNPFFCVVGQTQHSKMARYTLCMLQWMMCCWEVQNKDESRLVSNIA